MFDVLPITMDKNVDCGPTCMAMLLQYYGATYDMEQLVRECNCQISGCTGKDLLRVGKAHGLDMKAFRMDAEELIRQDRPAIIWWKYSHWCVFAGRDENGQVWICNPSRGRYRLDAGTFASFYSGVALFNGEPEDLPDEAAAEAE